MPTTPTLATRPSKLDWRAFPGQTRVLKLTGFANGYLDGRTYTLAIRGVTDTFDGTVDTGAETVTFTVTLPADLQGPHKLTITDTSIDDVIIRGTITVTDTGDTATSATEITVNTAEEITLDLAVTVLATEGGTGGGGQVEEVVAGAGISVDSTDPTAPVVTAEVTQAELDTEATTRAAADTALDGRLDTIEAISIATDAELAAAVAAEASARAAAIAAVVGGAPAGGDTLSELDARIAVVEALGSLATDAELIAAVAALIGTADTAGDTLGELQALIGLRLLKSANLSDLANPATARTNLGLGTAATADTGTGAANVPTKAQADGLYAPVAEPVAVAEAARAVAAEALLAPKASPTFTGTVTVPDDSFAFAKLQNIATARILGRNTASSGDIEELSAATTRSLLGLGALALLATVGTSQIDDDAVTLAKLANIATASFIGRTTASTGDPEVLTAAQAAAILGAEVFKQAQTVNAQTGTTYTLVAGDAGKLVTLSNASAITLTVPQDSDATIAVGTYVDLMQLGAGQVTVAAGTGATLRTSGLTAKARAQYSRLGVQKISANTWSLFGDLAAS